MIGQNSPAAQHTVVLESWADKCHLESTVDVFETFDRHGNGHIVKVNLAAGQLTQKGQKQKISEKGFHCCDRRTKYAQDQQVHLSGFDDSERVKRFISTIRVSCVEDVEDGREGKIKKRKTDRVMAVERTNSSQRLTSQLIYDLETTEEVEFLYLSPFYDAESRMGAEK